MLVVQQALRDGLYALGLTHAVSGQAEWPFSHRLAAEMLWVDAGHARRVAITGVCVGIAALLLLTACVLALVRKARGKVLAGMVIGAVALLLAAPWPAAHLLWAPAMATSLHRSDSGFRPAGIVRGQALFQQHCQQCHGADARGQGPLASTLGRWPPDLTGGLLWKRLEGELFGRIRHGMRDARTGRETMPGVAESRLSDADIWNVLDYLQAHAAGQSLRSMGAWERPVRMPRFALHCRFGAKRSSADLQGQRVLLRMPAQGDASTPQEDPRLVTVTVGAGASGEAAECASDDEHLPAALALLLGESEQGARGYQLLADRDGWLRARAAPGRAAWSEDDLVCRTNPAIAASSSTSTAAPEEGLETLLRRMDADPVQLVRAGFVH